MHTVFFMAFDANLEAVCIISWHYNSLMDSKSFEESTYFVKATCTIKALYIS